ncbi:hypothetical protein PCANC_05931 [Puccinia coronata f. sp. avenae]|uniref:Uncharacterized protein n=1 Tax=Puccinia coronata f. sp. avenae TaxID=200324 RepID=A0A2N5VY41_9BASI|nr:hypothetical protein PCANC_05931 [Puccinia coronata f. sp. avenae]
MELERTPDTTIATDEGGGEVVPEVIVEDTANTSHSSWPRLNKNQGDRPAFDVTAASSEASVTTWAQRERSRLRRARAISTFVNTVPAELLGRLWIPSSVPLSLGRCMLV